MKRKIVVSLVSVALGVFMVCLKVPQKVVAAETVASTNEFISKASNANLLSNILDKGGYNLSVSTVLADGTKTKASVNVSNDMAYVINAAGERYILTASTEAVIRADGARRNFYFPEVAGDLTNSYEFTYYGDFTYNFLEEGEEVISIENKDDGWEYKSKLQINSGTTEYYTIKLDKDYLVKSVYKQTFQGENVTAASLYTYTYGAVFPKEKDTYYSMTHDGNEHSVTYNIMKNGECIASYKATAPVGVGIRSYFSSTFVGKSTIIKYYSDPSCTQLTMGYQTMGDVTVYIKTEDYK